VAATSMVMIKHPRDSVFAKQTMHNGVPVIILKAKDLYGSIKIEGYQMWLQKWSPEFKPDKDLSSPIWVLLSEIPFHMHNWQYVRQVVSSVDTLLELDAATMGRTRLSLAK
ncbi:hypothetical protein HAX54_039026, partial [Datura stramonium]|nr:hypothetical protein [Datura stramonium]